MVKENLKLARLEEVMRAKYLSSQQDLRQYVRRENELRAELEKLDEQARQSEFDVHPTMKTVGADIIWKSWVGRTKTQLNLQLAQILAQKEGYLSRVRSDYGKLLVSEELNKKKLEDTRSSSRISNLSSILDTSLTCRNRINK